ncbi:transient receptor potential cation channel protein painless-like [Drosophila nasuta]|uniref:transient receptor potential cation channel protein painless-like n=1 Tax=Drosophila nasuta TaxID=42062 RepID=UPI00295F206B|nr:transient receptor potential cation channel protein painless-like [Drosophila nasuta]
MENYIEVDNYTDFENAIKNVKDASELTNVYEKLLSTPQRSRFLKLCLEKGCNKNYVNYDTGKAAINYAAESRHFINLFLLIYFNMMGKKDKSVKINIENLNEYSPSADESCPLQILPDIPKGETVNSEHIKEIDHKYKNQTALNNLASHLTSKTAGEDRECMELLLRNGAAVNAMDNSGEVPLSYVMKNTELSPNDKYELIYMLLQRYTTADSIAKEAWNYLKTNHMKKHSELKRDNLEDMISKRKNLEDMISTNQQIGKGLYLKRRLSDVYSRSNSLQGNYIKNLLERYANRGDVNAMKMLQQILGTISRNDIDFSLMCKSYGKEVFQELLNTPNLQIDYVELAKDFIEKMPSEFDKKEEHIKHVELLQILLKRRDGLASAADEEGRPLLSYAALKRNEVAVRELLRHGAYMGMRNDYKVLPIKNIRPEVIEEHLDYCIQMDAVKSNDSNITMDFTNICHPPNGPNTNPQLRYNDMSTIAYIKKSRNLRHLLNHPIVSTILVHKWQKYSKFFYTHFAIYLIFIILLTTLIVSDYRSLSYVCLPFIIYLAIHEVVQYNISPVHYFREFFVNGLDILVIILSIIVCCPWWTSRNFETFAVLASCFRLFSHMSLIPITWISKPFRMLFMVINTVFKLGILILVVFLFGLCFYIQNGNGTQVKSANETDSISFDFDTFASALMKSTIMATGEYDAGNIKITSLWQYLLLFVFVIIVGISLFNLLVAKALNDIQLIQNQAEIFSAINRINVLNTCEVLLYAQFWNILDQFKLFKRPSDNSLRQITIRQYNYPLKISTVYYKNRNKSNIVNEANAADSAKNSNCSQNNKTDRVSPDSSLGRKPDIASLKKSIFDSFKTNDIDYKLLKRAVEIAEKNSSRDPQTSQEIE